MKVEDFERVSKGAFPRLVARVPDTQGTEEFELIVSGPKAFLPFFRARGFAAGVCSSFLSIGF